LIAYWPIVIEYDASVERPACVRKYLRGLREQ
jgi:hypothetical protein